MVIYWKKELFVQATPHRCYNRFPKLLEFLLEMVEMPEWAALKYIRHIISFFSLNQYPSSLVPTPFLKSRKG